jgi:uncharacterized membrane protein HdeD (DUF308 family)
MNATHTVSRDTMVRSLSMGTAFRGLLAIVFGVIALANPGATALALVIVFAVWAFIDAACALGMAVFRGRAGERWGWFLFEGLVSIVAGALALGYPGITMLVLTIIVGARAIVLGILMFGGALAWKGQDFRWLHALTGVVSVIFGFMLIGHPGAGIFALVWAVGVYAIIVGVMQLGLAWQIHRTTAPPKGMPRPVATAT